MPDPAPFVECLTFLIKTYRVSGIMPAFALGNYREAAAAAAGGLRCAHNCTLINVSCVRQLLFAVL